MPEKKPSAAAMRIAQALELAHNSGVLASDRIRHRVLLIDAEFAPLVEATEKVCACLRKKICVPPDRQDVEDLRAALVKIKRN